MPRVFISYSHDTEEHKARVASLAQRLRDDGLTVVLDGDMLPGGPAEGWPLWSERQVTETDFVLVACTLIYSQRYEGNQPPGEGLGAVCEARAIRQFLYDHAGINEKIRVVLFDAVYQQYIPTQLKSYHSYQPLLEQSYGDLLAWLKKTDVPPPPPPEPLVLQWPNASPDYNSELADRKDEFTLFERMITGQLSKRILLLRGASNSGKTALMTALRAYALNLNLPVALLDFKGCPTLDQLLELLRGDLGPHILRDSFPAIGSRFLPSLISDLKRLKVPVVLMFDTYHEASVDSQDWLDRQLLQRLDQVPGVVVVIGGQSVPVHDKLTCRALVEVCELQPIRRVEDWLEYSDRKWQSSPITADQVLVLTLATDGNPGQLSALLETMALRLKTDHGE